MWYTCQGWGVSPLKGMSTIRADAAQKVALACCKSTTKLSASVRVCTMG